MNSYPPLEENLLNPGIHKLVNMLRNLGFNTTDSGDGYTNIKEGMECALDFPHVFMVIEPVHIVPESKRLLDLIRAFTDKGNVEVSYSPHDEVAILAVYNVLDEDINVG